MLQNSGSFRIAAYFSKISERRFVIGREGHTAPLFFGKCPKDMGFRKIVTGYFSEIWLFSIFAEK